MATISSEKQPLAPLAFLRQNALTSSLAEAYTSFSERRAKLGLVNPGSVENLTKEVQRDVLLNNYMFSGIRADITKIFSLNPLFQVSHQFALGDRLQPYTFAALYGTSNVFLQGNIDNEGSLGTRFNYRWGPKSVTKSQIQISPAGQDMVQLEHEYIGDDFTGSVKALNPSYLEGGLTGIFIGSYMQSLTSKFALGLEGIWQRAALEQPPETALSYCAKYKAEDWVATAQLQAQGAINTTFWKRIGERVQAGVDMTLSLTPSAAGMMGGGLQKEGITTFGAKYDFHMSTFRAQIDSRGKMGILIEKRVAPPVTLTIAADVDHATQAAKLGVSISLEVGAEELQEQQEAMNPAAGPNIPF